MRIGLNVVGKSSFELEASRQRDCCKSVSIVFWNCCIRFINGPCLIGGCGGRFRFGVCAARPPDSCADALRPGY